MSLTNDEIAKLTPFNALAYDLMRMNKKNESTPAFLCLSVDAINDIRKEFHDYYQQKFGQITLDDLEKSVSRMTTVVRLTEKWKRNEAELKQARQENDPSAFFFPDAKVTPRNET